jgi:hypothetical protein
MERRNLETGKPYRPEFTLGYFRNTFLQFLQMMYGSAAAPQDYKYSDNDADSKISIQAGSADNLKKVDARPRIVVVRGPIRFSNKSGIGHLQSSRRPDKNDPGMGGHDNKHVSDIVTGSVMINSISRDDLESERLANDNLFLIRRFKQLLARYGLLNIGTFEASGTGLIRGQDGGVSGYITSINIGLTAQDRWLIENDTRVVVQKIETILKVNDGQLTED